MNKNEFGLTINLNVNYDISAKTTLALDITRPDGTVLTKTPTVGTVPLNGFLANQYAVYRTIAGDINQAGTYSMRLTYNDASPKQLISDVVTFEVQP